MHKLTINNNRVFLDGVEVKFVKEYELKASADSQLANELILKLLVQSPSVTYEKELPARAYDLAPVIYEIVDVLAKHKILARSLDAVLDSARKEVLSRTYIQDSWANDVYIGNRN